MQPTSHTIAATGAAGARWAVLTGGTSGVGAATLKQLAAAGWNVLFTGRNRSVGERSVARLARRHPHQSFRFLPADLSSLPEVRRLAADITEQCPQIEALINNAGARIDWYQQTAEGHELTFATNHLGPFLLTALLLERVLAAPAGRVVTVSSRRHRFVKRRTPWMDSAETFERWETYSRAKLANALFSAELARRLNGTSATANAVDPGIVASRFARNNGLLPWMRHLVSSWRMRQLVSSEHAARTVVHVAASSAVARVSGCYFYEQAPIAPDPVVLDHPLAADLWEASLRWTGLAAGSPGIPARFTAPSAPTASRFAGSATPQT